MGYLLLRLPVYADFFVSKPTELVKLPNSRLIRPYALGEAIACCVHAGNRFGIQPGDKVAIIGCGFMGIGESANRPLSSWLVK